MGTSRFTAASLHDLPAVERNLHGLDRAFANETLWGLPAANRTVLHQPDGVEQALDAVRSAAMAATDTIVVYYAGHGLISEQSDELMLTLPRSDPARMYTSLPYAWLRNQLVHTATRARRKVIILDCCYAGRAGLDRMAPTGESIAQVVANQSMIEGACVLTATDAFTRAYAQSGAEYTAFTGALVEALTGGIPGPAALLDLTTLHVHLRDTLRSRGHPDPELRNRDTVGWVALARNVAHTVTEPGPGAVEQPPAIVRGVRDVGMIVETSLEQNVRRRRAGRDGGRVPDEQIGYVNHQLRQLTTTVGAVLRDLARPATVEDLAAVAAAHLGDPSVAQTLRTVNQAGQLRDLAVAVTTDGGIDAVRYALVAPIGLSIPAKVVWSAQGSRADLRNPTVLLARRPTARLLRWLAEQASRSAGNRPLLLLTTPSDPAPARGAPGSLTVAEVRRSDGVPADTIIEDLATMIGKRIYEPATGHGADHYERWLGSGGGTAQRVVFTAGSAVFHQIETDRVATASKRARLVERRLGTHDDEAGRRLDARLRRFDSGNYVLQATMPVGVRDPESRDLCGRLHQLPDLLTAAIDSGVLLGDGVSLYVAAYHIDPASSVIADAYRSALAEPMQVLQPAAEAELRRADTIEELREEMRRLSPHLAAPTRAAPEVIAVLRAAVETVCERLGHD